MIDAARVILLFAFAVLAGRVTVRAADGKTYRRGAAEMIGLSVAAGLGLMGLAVMWLGMAGVSASTAVRIFAGITLAGAAAWTWRSGRHPSPTTSNLSAVEAPPRPRWQVAGLIQLAAVAAFPIGMVAFDVVRHPVHEWDALAIWLFKAKVMYAAPLTPQPAYFHDLTLNYSHLDYPLLWPSMMAGVFAALGRADDHLVRWLDPALYFVMVAMIYAAARHWLGRLPAAALTALAANTPVFLTIAIADQADLSMIAFYVPAVYLAARWLADGRRGDLVLAILFNALVAQTKNEGMAVAAVNVVATGIASWIPNRGVSSNRRFGRAIAWVAYAGGVALLLAPWWIWSIGLPKTDEAYGQRMTAAALWAERHKVGPILKVMVGSAVDFKLWGFVWIAAIAIAIIGFRAFRRREVIAVWLMLVGHLLAYVAAYMVTPWDLDQLLRFTLERLLVHTTPAVFILMAMHWGALMPGVVVEPGQEITGTLKRTLREPCDSSEGTVRRNTGHS